MSATAPVSDLAHFLRSRRAGLAPEVVGLPRTGSRRLYGLRRAEVAALAGISPEYYTRLEQGRQRRPSPEVLDALATAMRLDEDSRRHLHHLAAGGAHQANDRAPVDPPTVPKATLRLLRSLSVWPAHVVTPMRDILAWNDAAAWLHVDFASLPTRYRNFAWFAFCDPRAPDLFADWHAVAHSNVNRLRHALAADPHNERGRQLVAELASQSSQFKAMWDKHDVRGPHTGSKTFLHPQAGPLQLDYTAYVIPGRHALELVVLTTDENSPTYAALTTAASQRRDRVIAHPQWD
ncbi:helix-turn-helix transcriptional regulator [Mycobacterium gastri]|uniref:HTH cro/C1-type domain-containing protein n=1 Tax=Mycobacterium gastri TaxID=1777 RepID=A0A1X1UWI2_MYCGS|nr:helix-turn-helix transcriptional regulator [Mycobacterium gastri]ETW21250.1 hypothetical protein MGAST_26990 [Mycobacterium gastri 'Wayne']ORV61048.1 hypothetical protein AWC07_17620 [Mycobacterium gastri]